MNQLFDLKKYGLTIVIFMVAFYVSTFSILRVPASVVEDGCFLSHLFGEWRIKSSFSLILGCVSILTVSLLVYIYFKNYTSRDSLIVAPLFGMLAFSLPVRFEMHPIFVSTILFTIVLILQSSLERSDKKEDNVFLTMSLLALASWFYAPLIWMSPVVFVLSLIQYDSKSKLLLNSITGLLLPFFLIFGAVAVFSDYSSIPVLLSDFWADATALSVRLMPVKTVSLLKNVLLVVVTIRIFFQLIPILGTIKVIKANFIKTAMVYLLSLFVLALLFCGNVPQVWILVMIPISALLFIYLTEKETVVTGKYIFFFMLLFLMVERAVWILQ